MAAMLQDDLEFVMNVDQKVVYEQILFYASQYIKKNRKGTFIVKEEQAQGNLF